MQNAYKIVGLQYGVRRMMLNAPVSMRFKHSIGRNYARNNLRDNVRITTDKNPFDKSMMYSLRVVLNDLNISFKSYGFTISEYAINLVKNSTELINARLNDMSNVAAKDAKIPFNAAMMKMYDKSWLKYPNNVLFSPCYEVSE